MKNKNKNKNPRWGRYPSPKAVTTFLCTCNVRPKVIVFDRADLLKELGPRAIDYLAEVDHYTSQADVDTITVNDANRDEVVERLHYEQPSLATYLVDTAVLCEVQNIEQRYHGRMVDLTDIPDDGDLGVIYVRDVNGPREERKKWRVEPVLKVGSKYLTIGFNQKFDKTTGANSDSSYGYLQRARFAHSVMDDEIFDAENRSAIIRRLERCDVETLRQVAALLGE